MAKSRPNIYIHATWLAKVMSGNVACQWQFWFQAHNQLTERQPSTLDLVEWNIEHTRRLAELTQELIARGFNPQNEFSFKLKIPSYRTIISGQIDCLVISDSLVEIYDCKTGNPRDYDQVQVMIYMYALSQDPKFDGKKLHGYVVYESKKVEIPKIPNSFASNFDYFVSLLASNTSPIKIPGKDCRFCSITRIDCPERADFRNDILLKDLAETHLEKETLEHYILPSK